MLLHTTLGLFCQTCQGGGGPENVFLVVNARSWASRTVANRYAWLRKIPPRNLYHLDYGSYQEGLPVEFFRRDLLRPILAEIEKRKLGPQIDHIVFSTDFPFSYSTAQDLQGADIPPQVAQAASLTGLMTLSEQVLAEHKNYHELYANRYFRGELNPEKEISTVGFRHWVGWDSNGVPVAQGGQKYYLSTCLGVTYGRGNSVREIINYLDAAVSSDGVHPNGTIYYVAKNDDIRTQVRRLGGRSGFDRFEAACERIQKLGVAAKIVNGATPRDAKDVQGAMMGVPAFQWADSNSTIRPGAICEHFTSFGGVLGEDRSTSGQTQITELLRYGAAGSCGTVGEPMSFPQKFPCSAMHLHYVKGCCMAEAVYQSVACPYQLLVLGDPLCQPWAAIQTLKIEGLKPSETVKGAVPLRVLMTSGRRAEPSHVEIFVDGLRRASVMPNQEFSLPTEQLEDGSHEIRAVAVSNDLIQTQSRAITAFTVNNQGAACTLSLKELARVRYGETVDLFVQATGATSIHIFCHGELAAKLAGEGGQISLSTANLGQGTLPLRAEAFDGKGKLLARSETILVEVEGASPLINAYEPTAREKPGLRLKLAGQPLRVLQTVETGWFKKLGAQPNQSFEIEGRVLAPQSGDYQFHLGYGGDCSLEVDGKVLHDKQEMPLEFHFVHAPLAEGWHRVRLRGRTGAGQPEFVLAFGEQGVKGLTAANTRSE